ncbi:MAG: hypothetical protein PWQ91_1197 [Eubacteriales bacterium]|nr:hypothetical protein [Eubacteriales bacterium]MDN5364136.1 hypothetical protein [Eubacteriales bacterium]
MSGKKRLERIPETRPSAGRVFLYFFGGDMEKGTPFGER